MAEMGSLYASGRSGRSTGGRSGMMVGSNMMGLVDGQMRRDNDVHALQEELQRCRAEEHRMVHAMQMHQVQVQRNELELVHLKEWMKKREVEVQNLRTAEDLRIKAALHEYQQRYERERFRLRDALTATAESFQKIVLHLPAVVAAERELYGQAGVAEASLAGLGQKTFDFGIRQPSPPSVQLAPSTRVSASYQTEEMAA